MAKVKRHLCFHCKSPNPQIWSVRLRASVHTKCHEKWLSKEAKNEQHKKRVKGSVEG